MPSGDGGRMLEISAVISLGERVDRSEFDRDPDDLGTDDLGTLALKKRLSP